MFSAQEKRLVHFSEVGKVASGLLHDLSNIFMSVSMEVQEINNISNENTKYAHLKMPIEKILDKLDRANMYFLFAQKHIQLSDAKEVLHIAHELQKIKSVLDFRLKKQSVVYKEKIQKNVFIYGDSVKFYQIISNIISNAIDACDSEPPRIARITLTVLAKENKVIISIKDNGVGIKKDHEDKIFTPFFTTKKEGTGIGLSVVKTIIEKEFFGTIDFFKNKNSGVTFKLVFPRHK